MSDRWPSLYSHPDETEDGEFVAGTLLEEHLETVGQRCVASVPDDAKTDDGLSVTDAAQVVGWLHDIGKATEWFQTYLDDGDPSGPTHHARLGGLAVYYALRELGFEETMCVAGLHAVAKHHGSLRDTEDYVKAEFRSAGVRRSWETGRNHEATKQAELLEEDSPEFAAWSFDAATNGAVEWSSFLDWLRELPPGYELSDAARGFEASRPLDDETGGLYTRTLQLWSALAFADITAASGIEDGDSRLGLNDGADDVPEIHPKTIREYAEEQGDDSATGDADALNEVRTETQSIIEDRAGEFSASEQQEFTLTLPTGYGKTVAGTLAALHLRAETTDRVVYALPFTSVIDQTASVLKDKNALDTDAMGRLLTVHHHLAETLTTKSTDDGDDEPFDPTDKDAEAAQLLAEAWRSRMTLTTFVQLFESLAAPDRGQSVKLPALEDSVIVLDEPQALPLEWWPLVRALVAILTEEYDVQVVSMTATQPQLLPSAKPLLPSDRLAEIERTAFDGEPPSRVAYEFTESAMATDDETTRSYADAAGTAVEAAAGGPTLCVCNTIDSARHLSEVVAGETETEDIGAVYAEELPDEVGDPRETDGDEADEEESEADGESDDGDESDDTDPFVETLVSAAETAAESGRTPLVHLSTRLRPCDRAVLISVVEELTERGVPSLVVSTQLIEAGVDVSFRQVFRDVAPLDSIVQAAGRCNRSYGGDRGQVTVWRLPAVDDEGGMTPSEAVYARSTSSTDTNTLVPTREALRDVGVEAGDHVPGRTVAREAVEQYHDKIGAKVDSVAEDNRLVGYLETGEFGKLGRESLVGSELSFEVYVCRTPKEQTRVRQLSKAYQDREFDAVEKARSELAEIRVSVPVYNPASEDAEQLQRLPPIDPRADKDDATERSLDAMDQHEHAFDKRVGVDQDELGVEARIL